MANMNYTLVREGDESTLTVYRVPDFDQPFIAHSSHVKWDEILEAVLRDDLVAIDLIDTATYIKNALVSERLSVAHNRLLFDGDPVDDSLSEFILKMIDTGDPDYEAFVNFTEKLYSNPQEHSREHLFNYLRKYNVSITADGDLILYKGLSYADDYERFNGQKPYVSGHAGPANVSGYEHARGKVPQAIGDIVSMPRSATWTNPTVACSTGLHVATWGYWHTNYPVTVMALVNPRDVVSVPHDDAKIRCCRYRLIEVSESPCEEIVMDVEIPPVPEFDPNWEPQKSTQEPEDEWDDLFTDFTEPEPDVEPQQATVTVQITQQRSPSELEWGVAREAAKRQRKGVANYIGKRWTLIDGCDGSERTHWIVKE